MKIPYIRVKQKGEIFFLTKFKAKDLKDRIHFHIRDPYLKHVEKENDNFNEYIKKLNKKGININEAENEIQRRISLSRINEISEYIKGKSSNFLPNTVILSVDISESDQFSDKYDEYESQEIGMFEFDNTVRFMVIDGQHRLAGIFTTEESVIEEIEIPAVILFNVSLSTAAKLFSDINGKVKPVNRSLVYDLYENIEETDYSQIKKLHLVCKNFYDNETSPLFRQIKMLGVGKGAISQAFFIDYALRAIKEAKIESHDAQYIYSQLFVYFKVFQELFPEDWPVPVEFSNYIELEKYSENVLNVRKSQLVKTNGFGAIMKLFPLVYKKMSSHNVSDYYFFLLPLENKMSWTYDANIPSGTGIAFQNHLFKQMKEILEI